MIPCEEDLEKPKKENNSSAKRFQEKTKSSFRYHIFYFKPLREKSKNFEIRFCGNDGMH